MSKVILAGHGPHVRFKTTAPGGSVRIVLPNKTVTKVPLAKVTDLRFQAA